MTEALRRSAYRCDVARADADRSPRSWWEVGAFSNLRLLGVVAFSAALQFAMHHVPVAQAVFGLPPVSPRDCLLSIALGFVPVSLIEISKLYGRKS